MNPRILKKLCKRIFDIGHPIAKDAWLDSDEPIGGIYIGNHIWREDRPVATAKRKRSHYMTKTTIRNIYVVGGGVDYWGEGLDPADLFSVSLDHVLWKVGTPTKCAMRDECGEIIDEVDGWPETNKRLTGQFVIKFLRDEMQRTGGR